MIILTLVKTLIIIFNLHLNYIWIKCLIYLSYLFVSKIVIIAGGIITGFIPFPRVLVLCEMQSVSSRIWTLSNIRYDSRIKWSHPGKEVAPAPTPRCSSYWKGSFREPSTTVANFTYIYLVRIHFISSLIKNGRLYYIQYIFLISPSPVTILNKHLSSFYAKEEEEE